MTDDRIGGALRKGAGHVQDAFGGLTGDTRTQAEGKLNEAAGSIQNAYGKAVDQAQDIFGDAEDFIKAQPLAAVGAALGIGLVLGLILRGGRKGAGKLSATCLRSESMGAGRRFDAADFVQAAPVPG